MHIDFFLHNPDCLLARNVVASDVLEIVRCSLGWSGPGRVERPRRQEAHRIHRDWFWEVEERSVRSRNPNDFNTIDCDFARTPSHHTRNQIARDFLAVQSSGRLQRMTSFEDGHAWELCLKNGWELCLKNGFATPWRAESKSNEWKPVFKKVANGRRNKFHAMQFLDMICSANRRLFAQSYGIQSYSQCYTHCIQDTATQHDCGFLVGNFCNHDFLQCCAVISSLSQVLSGTWREEVLRIRRWRCGLFGWVLCWWMSIQNQERIVCKWERWIQVYRFW